MSEEFNDHLSSEDKIFEMHSEKIFQPVNGKIFELGCSHCLTGCVAGDERIRDFRYHQDIHDSGIEVDYRCPRRRDCVDCKSADRTE